MNKRRKREKEIRKALDFINKFSYENGLNKFVKLSIEEIHKLCNKFKISPTAIKVIFNTGDLHLDGYWVMFSYPLEIDDYIRGWNAKKRISWKETLYSFYLLS